MRERTVSSGIIQHSKTLSNNCEFQGIGNHRSLDLLRYQTHSPPSFLLSKHNAAPATGREAIADERLTFCQNLVRLGLADTLDGA
jgi:hypothetical protein